MIKFSWKFFALTLTLTGASSLAHAQAQSARANTNGRADAWWPSNNSTPSDGDTVDLTAALKNAELRNIGYWVSAFSLTLKDPQVFPPGASSIEVGPCTIELKSSNSTAFIDLKRGREFKFYSSNVYSDNVYLSANSTDPTIGRIRCNRGSGSTVGAFLESLKPAFDYKLDMSGVKRTVGTKPATPKDDALAYDFEQGEQRSAH